MILSAKPKFNIRSHQNVLKVTIVCGLALIVASCDEPITCPDACPNPNEIRDFFCGCFDPNERKKHASDEQIDEEEKPIVAQCICPYTSGLVGAYFNYQPNKFGNFRPLEIEANSCANLTLCERIEQPGDGFTQKFQTGQIRLQPKTWNTFTNLLTGDKIYYVLGHAMPDMTYNSGQTAPLQNQLASLIKLPAFYADQYAKMAYQAQNPFLSNSVEGCKTECSSDSPYCTKDDLPADTKHAIQNLVKILFDDNVTEIPQETVMDLFGISDDPCGRSYTKFYDGRFENFGDACRLDTYLAELGVSAELSIPAYLGGEIVRNRNETRVSFDEHAAAPFLEVSDDYLNSDFGGPLKSMYTNGSILQIGVGARSCIETRLQ